MKNHDIRRILFILIPVYVFIISVIFGLTLFGTNDDVNIMDILSGRMIGEPYACTNFFHIFLGFILSSLYKLAYLPWFPAFIVITTLLGMISVYDVLYDFLKSKAHIFIKVFASLFFFFLTITIVVYPTYTNSATLIGIAGIYLLYKNKNILSIIALMLATAIRYESGFVVSIFWVGVLLYKTQKENNINNLFILIKKTFLKALIVILAVVAVYASDEIIKKQIEPEGYAEFRRAIQKNIDYSKTPEFYENCDKIFESIGWDKDLYYTHLNEYFIMDDRINTDSLKTLNKYAANINNFSPESVLRYTKTIVFGKSYDNLFNYLFVILNIYFLIALVLKSKNNGSKIIIFLLFLTIAFGLICYLLIVQRFVFRGALPIMLSSLLLNIYVFNDVGIEYKGINFKYLDILALAIVLALFIMHKSRLPLLLITVILAWFSIKDKRVIAAISLILIIISSSMGIDAIKSYSSFMNYIKAKGENRDKIVSYLLEHRDNIYINTDYIDNRMLAPKNSYYNLFFFGGTNARSSACIKQMKKAGLKRFDIAELKNDNVYLVNSKSNSYLRDFLLEAIKQKQSASHFELVNIIKDTNMGVYKLIQ